MILCFGKVLEGSHVEGLVHLRAGSMKPKSLQTSVSERGPSVESFFWSAFEPVTAPSLVPWSSIGARKNFSKGFFGL